MNFSRLMNERHNNIYRYRCTQCSLAFRTEQTLANHSLFHEFRTSARCTKCECNFRSQQMLDKHISQEHINGKSTCNTLSAGSQSCLGVDGGSDEKVMINQTADPLRLSYKCELCSENFEDKNQLLSHYNSVGHLHRAKKMLEEQSGSFQPSPQILAALQASSTSGQKTSHGTLAKPFKCNLCKLSYGQGSTLDIHIRSVAHQARLSKVNELIAQGDLDPLKPILEQPNGQAQKTIAEIALKGGEHDLSQNGLEQQQSALAMINMLNMAHLISMASVNPNNLPGLINSLPSGSQATLANIAAGAGFPSSINPFGSISELSSNQNDRMTSNNQQSQTVDDRTPRTGVAFRKMLETYGFDVVMQYNEMADRRKRKLDSLPDDRIPELCRAQCTLCLKSFSSIWVLKAHLEEVHESLVTTEVVERFAMRLREELDRDDINDDGGVEQSGEDEKENDEGNDPTTTTSGAETTNKQVHCNSTDREADASTSGGATNFCSTTDGVGDKEANDYHMDDGETDNEDDDDREQCAVDGKINAEAANEENYKPEVKRCKEETSCSSNNSTPRPSTSKDALDLNSQLAMMGMLGFPFMANPFMPMISPDFFANPLFAGQQTPATIPNAISSSSPTKRARTRITDDQLKILRQYFDINNSPSEQQIKEMSVKAQLPEKVIKHWFRNTLFKERQRDKDSPYNFSVPPQMSIDLDTYEKTGEAKITSLKNEQEDEEQPMKADISKPRSMSPSNSMINIPVASTSAHLPQLSGTSTTVSNPFAAFLHDEKGLTSILSNALQSNSSSGRRANRTRFTDYQLRTLQQFFDKQAYPKDDDLEVLSKKLQLSPRVIVVWFQNARQKARKIYENQPTTNCDDRFMKTPGSNFQCKRCQLVFQRYYELIQHQQKHCYKDDCIAQQKDNKAVEEGLSEDEKTGFELDGRDNAISAAAGTSTTSGQANIINSSNNSLGGALAQLIGTAASETGTDISNADFLKLLASAKSSQDSALKLRVREKRKAIFYKRCPFCCLLFHSRDSLILHIPSKHAEQACSTPVNVDLLPDAEDVPTITMISSDESPSVTADQSKSNGGGKKSDSSPLDLSCTSNGEGLDDSMSISPSYGQSDDNDDNNSDNVETSERYNSASPSALGGGSLGAQRSPASSKRYRTHLTPLQVHVMKSIFADYKTPSMSECDLLGANIGLHKRVVQVWFQNARAKERKSRAYTGDDEMLRATSSRCAICSIEYDHRVTLHDHIFSTLHISKIKKLKQTEGSMEISARDQCNNTVGNDELEKEETQRIRTKTAVRDRKLSKPSSAASLQGMAGNQLPQFPYGLLYGLQPGIAAPMMYDPNLMGTPIPMLQIPENVMAKITTDLSAGRPSSKFTQDGKIFQQLVAVLPLRDFQCAGSTDSEVGWACPQCTNVFQQEQLLKNHQRLICQGCDSVFVLIQTHYECRACNAKFGTQAEFKLHCDTSDHQKAREIFLGRAI